MANKKIYLDYAAATPLDKWVLAAMQPYFSDKFFNPSATYLAAQEVDKDIEAARAGVARWLGARPGEVVFTAGGTEANNLAIHGVMQSFPDGEAVVSAIEHDSVLEPVNRYKHTLVPVTKEGIIKYDALKRAINDKTVLISVMYANNEAGTIQPIKEIAAMINEVKKQRQASGSIRPLYFHTDACQAANYLDLHVKRLGADLMTLNGGKIYGPKQSGALYIRAGTELRPQTLGGGQENGRRSGTENVAGIIGFSTALGQAQEQRVKEGKRLAGLQKQFYKELQKLVSGAIINGSLKKRLPNNVHVTIPGYDNERLMYELDEQGVQCAAGSACSASNEEPSHVLKAMGLSDASAQSSLRFTMGRQTTAVDISAAVQKLANSL